MMRVALIVVAAALAARALSADSVVLEWPLGRLTLNGNARVTSLIDAASKRECARAADVPVATVRVDGQEYPASVATPTDDGFELRFADCDTVLQYASEARKHYLLLTLRAVEGTRPEAVTLLRLPVAVNAHVGRILDIAWDEEVAVCAMAGNLQVRCAGRGDREPLLTALTRDAPGPRLEGASVAVIVCPTREFRAIAREAAHDGGVPTNEDAEGTPVKETDLVRGSYWFMRVDPSNVQRMIEYCELAGIRQVMISSNSWCRTVGHYTFQPSYPNGLEDLRTVVARLHDHGILVGMHCFASKVSKTDAYVTPIPDRRFWVDRRDTLAEDLSPDATEVRVSGDLREWPGSPVASQKTWEGGVAKHREVIIDDEIIKYEAIGPEGRWDTFLGCERGAWGTAAVAHSAGTPARHYGVDGCINGYIIDQETDLMAEVADRLANIFNECDFDMIYFDGGEDVDRRRSHYYSTNFQYQVMRRLAKRPIIHMGTVLTHRLWHSFARSGTVDTYLNTLHGAIASGRAIDEWPTVREHIDRSVRRAVGLRDDLMPAELGWFGIWPAGENTDGLQLDEVEYLMCRSLAYDLPVSLETSFTQMDRHPLTREILRIFRAYEELRMSRALPAEVTAPLGEIGRDFALVRDRGEVRFVPVVPAEVGGGREVRAMVGAVEDGSVATLWHFAGRRGRVRVDLPPAALRVTDLSGAALDVRAIGGAALVPFGAYRTTIHAQGVDAETLTDALAEADVTLRRPELVFVRAADFARIEGEMGLGSAAGIEEPEAFGDVLTCTARPNREHAEDWFAEYTVDIPHAGVWTLWARVRYPRGGDMSFGLVLPGQEVTLSGTQVLGNCGVHEGQWHWTGRGGGLVTVPPGEPISLELDRGRFTFRIYAREGVGPPDNPRLDLICLSDDPLYVPTDDDARRALVGRQG